MTYGLGQTLAHPGLAGPLLVGVHRRGQDHDAGRCQGRVGGQRLGQLQPVHLRHAHVEYGHRVGMTRIGRIPHLRQRGGSVGGDVGKHLPGLELGLQHQPVGLVVINHQHPQPGQ